MSLFFLSSVAQSYHGSLHTVIGMIAKDSMDDYTYNFLDELVGTFGPVLAAHSNEQCKRVSPEYLTTFADAIKAGTTNMSDWHWNDLVGTQTYYTKRDGTVGVVEPNDPVKRNASLAACTEGDGCYGIEGVNHGIVTNGELTNALNDLKAVISDVNSNDYHNQSYAFALTLNIINGLHYFGDSHMPLHSGSMFSQVGLDSNCCQKDSNSTEVCAPTVNCTDNGEYPNIFCRPPTDFDTSKGSDGDQGGNKVFLIAEGDPTSFASAPGKLHYYFDSGCSMFETNDATSVFDQCNVDSDGNLKNYEWVSQIWDTTKREFIDKKFENITYPEIYATYQEADAYVYSEANAMLKCHSTNIQSKYPRSAIQALAKAAFKSFMANVDRDATIPQDFFNPVYTSFEKVQEEMNFLRQNFYYAYFVDNGFKGADCMEIGITLPKKVVEDFRESARILSALAGYRMANFFDTNISKDLFDPIISVYNKSKACGVGSSATPMIASIVATALIALVL